MFELVHMFEFECRWTPTRGGIHVFSFERAASVVGTTILPTPEPSLLA